jgi:outer membrane immunogenic protein
VSPNCNNRFKVNNNFPPVLDDFRLVQAAGARAPLACSETGAEEIRVKKLLFAETVSAALIASAPAGAADLAARGPVFTAPVTAPAYDWTGLYLGAHAGYAWGHSDPSVTYVADPTNNAVPAPLPTLSGGSALGGVQAGYNWQVGRWLVGGEADFSWLNAKADAFVEPFWVTDPSINNLTLSSRYEWLTTGRLRAGFLVTPDLLVYATGGLAVTRVQDYANFTFPTFPSTAVWSESRTLFGGTIGGGFEYAFAPHWSLKGEYLHAAFNAVLPQWTTPGIVAGSPVKFAHSLDIARVGVNYRWDAPPGSAAGAMPLKASPAYARPWTGFYGGLHAGYAWGASNPELTADTHHPLSFGDPLPFPAIHPTGGLGGIQLGYNWQSGMWVLGGEADFSVLNVKADTVAPFGFRVGDIASFSSKYDWLATARLRLGAAIAPNWLVYATGGLAVTRVTDTIDDTNIPPGLLTGNATSVTYRQSSTLFGGTIGGGFEYAFAPAWTLKAEYLYAAFNKTAPQTDLVGFSTPVANFDHNLNIVRLGVNYRFGAP